MNDTPQPEAVWVFPEKKRNTGRVWLIVLLSIAALAIVAVTLFLLLPRDAAPLPTASPTVSSTPSPTVITTPSPSPIESRTPDATAPPVVDPDLETFAGQVEPRLNDAGTGLSMISRLNGQDAVQVVDQLQQDAQRLSDLTPPSSISSTWQPAVAEYAERLSALRGALENGSGTQSALEAAERALQAVRELVGL